MGASVASAAGASSTAGASVAAPPPQAASIMLASTTSESRTERFLFTFLLLRENVGYEIKEIFLLKPLDKRELYNKTN
jgi:hypothetical protein